MKPFLLLATRAEDEAADDEYAGFLDAGELQPHQLERLRLEQVSLPWIDLANYSGIIVGGSPYNTSDAAAEKTAVQRRVEGELDALLVRVLQEDFPFLGACYGIGLLTTHLHGVVGDEWPERPGPTRVHLSTDGERDAIFGQLRGSFDAFVGHKEACTVLPEGAVLLASGDDCPVQAFRVGENVYATQFHPELTRDGIITRIRIYSDNGYFEPDSLQEILAAIGAAEVTEPARVVRGFVERYAVN